MSITASDAICSASTFDPDGYSRWEETDLDGYVLSGLESLQIPNDELQQIAKRNPPPQSWFEMDEEDLF